MPRFWRPSAEDGCATAEDASGRGSAGRDGAARPSNRLDRSPENGYIWRAMTVREILDAIHALPRPDRLRLVEQLNDEALCDRLCLVELQPPPDSMLEVIDGFYVYTGRLADPAIDHRADREAQVDHLIARLDAPRH